jgi:plasmid stabilization system protein ParE
MSLGDDVKALRDRALEDLKDAHDYYTDTRFAWSRARRMHQRLERWFDSETANELISPSTTTGKLGCFCRKS